MTETATIVTSNSEDDILNKSSGSLLPATRAKIFGLDGTEVKGYDTPGELWVQSPSATIGYLNNQKATTETFVFDEDGRWVRTGDEAVVTLSPLGNEHIVIVDRIKELIKVKGMEIFQSGGNAFETNRAPTIRPPSRPSRTRGTSSLPSSRSRLRCDPSARRLRRRGPQGICGQGTCLCRQA